MKGYRVHMISLENLEQGGYSVAFGRGENLHPWHLDVLETWIAERRAKKVVDDGSDLV